MQRLSGASVPSRFVRAYRRDDGLSFVFVAVIMVMLIGMVAFALDVGALYVERRELQSGADAAVLAIAEDCGLGLPCSQADALATAQAYASDNARDNAATIFDIDLDSAAGTIAVTTNSELPGGARILPPLFAQVIGFPGTEVRAYAKAGYGAPMGATALPLIVSDCEWFPNGPDVAPLQAGDDFFFTFHDGNTTEDCNAMAGQDYDSDGLLSGGFGWLATDGDCWAVVTGQDGDGADVVAEDPGASPPSGCSAGELHDLLMPSAGEPYPLIPWFEDAWGLGANGEYKISGVGAIKVTGYNFGGQYKYDPPCSGDERCIAGTVQNGTIFDGEFGGEDRGVLLVKLIG